MLVYRLFLRDSFRAIAGSQLAGRGLFLLPHGNLMPLWALTALLNRKTLRCGQRLDRAGFCWNCMNGPKKTAELLRQPLPSIRRVQRSACSPPSLRTSAAAPTRLTSLPNAAISMRSSRV